MEARLSICISWEVLNQNPNRIFKHSLQGLKEGGSHGSIYHAVVTGEGYLHYISWYDFTILHNWSLLNSAYGEDANIRWVDNSRKFFHSKHPKV